MSEFEVGQPVKVIADNLEALPAGQFIGLTGVVKQVGGSRFEALVALDGHDESPLWFDDDELEAVA